MPLFDQSVPLGEAMTPYADLVAVRLQREAEKTKGDILLPDQARKMEVFAEVVAVGPLANEALNVLHLAREVMATKDAPAVPQLAVGDWVIMSPYAGYTVEWGGDPYKIVRASDLFCGMNLAPQLDEVPV